MKARPDPNTSARRGKFKKEGTINESELAEKVSYKSGSSRRR